jgi:hypothetical protein
MAGFLSRVAVVESLEKVQVDVVVGYSGMRQPLLSLTPPFSTPN